jgi:phosphatidylserine/phosphatidylglycerophosphate/cardiolipin synthase-like enzyme
MATLEQLEETYFASGETHIRDTAVIPHLDGKAYFAAVQEALDRVDSADDVIYMSAWFFRPQMQLTPSALNLAEVLHNKADIGADVRVILWTGRWCVGAENLDSSSWFDAGFAAGIGTVGNFVSNTRNNILMALQLRQLNPNNREHPPLVGSMLMDHGGGKLGCRHHKVVIVYHRATNDLRAFVGGLDFAPSRLGEPRHPEQNGWHDATVELRGGAAMAVWSDFRTRWEEAVSLPERFFRLEGQRTAFNNVETLNRPLVPPPPQVPSVTSNCGVRVLRSYGAFREKPIWGDGEPWKTVPAGGIREVLPTYIKAINSVTKNPDPNGPPSYIYIEDQYLNTHEAKIEHDLLYSAIARAVNRDVKVVFIVPGRADPDDPASSENQNWTLSLAGMLSLIQPDKWDNFIMYRIQNVFVHTKVLLINDEFLSIGTANFADRSMEGLDTELQTTIVTTGSLVRDFRVRLWADHLRVVVTPHVFDEIADLKKSLGIFDEDWGTDVDFDHSQDAFRLVTPLFD